MGFSEMLYDLVLESAGDMEEERKFFDERIPPEEFIMKELRVSFRTLWSSLENPENIIRSLIEYEKMMQSK
ncbi:MAG: hypothetical protein QXJ19_04375 [Candidatus Bathyarchaeia archaeon]